MKPRQQAKVNQAIWIAELTNKELMILRLWMDGYGGKEIAFIMGLKIGQSAMSKQITGIRNRVKRAYTSLDTIRMEIG